MVGSNAHFIFALSLPKTMTKKHLSRTLKASAAKALAFTLCISTQAIATPTSQQAYIGYALQNPQQVERARAFNFEIAKSIRRRTTLNVDTFDGDSVNNLHSNPANRNDIQQLDSRLQQVTPSNDLALIAAINRVREQSKTGEPLIAYIVHPGTRDPKTLAAIQRIAKEIALVKNAKIKIYLMGMSPALKIPTVTAFSPIGKLLGGSCTDEYTQCRKFLNDLR
jgi:hypothetical protein